MKIKLSQIGSAICLLLIAAFAKANNFYIGLGGGAQSANFDQKAHIIIQPPDTTAGASNVSDTTELSGTGVWGSLFGGYRWNIQHFSLTAEMNANASSVQFNSTNANRTRGTSSSTKYSMPNSFGFSLLPGYLYNERTVFYGRLGYALGNFKTSTTDTSLANISRYLNGFCYGLGADHLFTQHIAARMEYDQIVYQNTQFYVVSGAANKTTKIRPFVNQVLFSLMYAF